MHLGALKLKFRAAPVAAVDTSLDAAVRVLCVEALNILDGDEGQDAERNWSNSIA